MLTWKKPRKKDSLHIKSIYIYILLKRKLSFFLGFFLCSHNQDSPVLHHRINIYKYIYVPDYVNLVKT